MFQAVLGGSGEFGGVLDSSDAQKAGRPVLLRATALSVHGRLTFATRWRSRHHLFGVLPSKTGDTTLTSCAARRTVGDKYAKDVAVSVVVDSTDGCDSVLRLFTGPSLDDGGILACAQRHDVV